MPNILVIEDNKDILVNIVDYLALKGFITDCAQDGLSGLHLATSEDYDLIVLDLMLPGLDGYQLCQRLRQEARLNTPIIMLTARDTLENRLQGFEAGADDYLVKPFALSELMARIEAVLRRTSGENTHLLEVEDLCLNLDTMQVFRAGHRLKVNPAGLKILELLIRKCPAVVRRSDIEKVLWNDDVTKGDNLRSHIHQLRQVVDKPFPKPLIHTVPKVGYRIVGGDNGF